MRIALTDDRIFLMENDTVFINEAMIKDGQIDPMCGNRTSKEIVVNVDMSRLAQCADNVERLAKSIRQTLQDSVKAGLPRLGGKLITAEDFKPGCSPHEFAGGLLRMAPITSNGKAPVNILPQGVDYKD